MKRRKQKKVEASTYTFYTVPLHTMRIPGLSVEIRGSTLVLHDTLGIKWEVRPMQERSLAIYHRSSQGGAMHQQQRITHPRTWNGVHAILEYISHHEEWEREHHGEALPEEE